MVSSLSLWSGWRTRKHAASIGQNDPCSVCRVGSVLGPERLDGDLVSRFQRILCPSKPHQAVGIRGLDHPADFLSFRPGNIHGDPSVRVYHFPLYDDAFERYRFLKVELSGERVMSDGVAAGQHEGSEQREQECIGIKLHELNLLTSVTHHLPLPGSRISRLNLFSSEGTQ